MRSTYPAAPAAVQSSVFHTVYILPLTTASSSCFCPPPDRHRLSSTPQPLPRSGDLVLVWQVLFRWQRLARGGRRMFPPDCPFQNQVGRGIGEVRTRTTDGVLLSLRRILGPIGNLRVNRLSPTSYSDLFTPQPTTLDCSIFPTTIDGRFYHLITIYCFSTPPSARYSGESSLGEASAAQKRTPSQSTSLRSTVPPGS